MATYPFTAIEQETIRELGRLRFRYSRETKKAIEFVRDEDEAVIELNREHSGLALVFGFGDRAALSALAGVVVTGDRASSNFSALAKSRTRNGLENHQGWQATFDSPALVAPALARLA
jgi:hypothetical protein